MKNKLSALILSFVLMATLNLEVFALVNSIYDINDKSNQLNKLSTCDVYDFFNKTSLIGERLNNFNMMTSQYMNEAASARDSLRSISEQINVLQSSHDISNSEKNLQINRLYKDAENIVYDLDSKTIQYLYSVRKIMPPITYQKYSKKFKSFYDGLNISDTVLSI